MHKLIITALLVTLFASCDSSEKKGNLSITGNVKGLKKGKLYIKRLQDTTFVALDTVVVNGDSNFESNLQLDSPEMLYLIIDRGNSNSLDNSLPFFAEPGAMTITTDLDFFLGNAKITGSKNQELYQQYKEIIDKFNEQQLELIRQDLLNKKNNTIGNEQLTKKQDLLIKRKYLYAANYALTHKDNEIAPYIAITDIYDINLKYLDTIQKSLSPKIAKSKYGQKLNDYLQEIKKNN